MKVLWAKSDFLHPTTRGGQIRSLEILKRLHRRHEIHYVGFEEKEHPEGPRRAGEYSTRHYAVAHEAPEKKLLSPAFAGQLLTGLWSPLPVAIRRWASAEMRRRIAALQKRERFDALVCDFLFVAPNVPELSQAVLFQHNVEAVIWERRARNAGNPVERWYLRTQARRMAAYEGKVCQAVKRVIAVSRNDAELMRSRYGAGDVQWVATGVDVEFFRRPEAVEPAADLVFVGSMDWLPNSDGVLWFMREIFPRIREKRPQTTVAIVGRRPGSEILSLAGGAVRVTGTVADVRPWLWGALAAVVPLRIGGGTRLKIYEAMAAAVPVISTRIGAEGLDAEDGVTIALADDPESFAARCVELLDSAEARRNLAWRALDLVRGRYSWDEAARQFEELLA